MPPSPRPDTSRTNGCTLIIFRHCKEIAAKEAQQDAEDVQGRGVHVFGKNGEAQESLCHGLQVSDHNCCQRRVVAYAEKHSVIETDAHEGNEEHG